MMVVANSLKYFFSGVVACLMLLFLIESFPKVTLASFLVIE